MVAKRIIFKQHTSMVLMGSGLRLGFKPLIHISHLLSHVNTLSIYDSFVQESDITTHLNPFLCFDRYKL